MCSCKALLTKPNTRVFSTAEQATSGSTSQHTDSRNDQAAFLQKLRQEAFEAGFKAGYQKGVQVQVSVSIDLDDDNGSYLRRQQGRSRGDTQQPWLPQRQQQPQPASQSEARGRAAAAAQSQATVDSSSSSASVSPAAAAAAGDSVVRSAVKGLVWRVFSTTATVSVALLVLQDSLQVSDAVKFGGIEFATKYVMYFLHERLWAAIALL